MPTAYFSRILNDTSWNDLLKNTQMQKSQKCKPLHYNILTELVIASSDFDILENTLSKPNQCYLKYAAQSVADEYGIWNCIVVKSETDSREAILFTAGRTFPLYAAANIK